MPPPHPIAPAVHGAANRRKHRANLDARIAECDQRVYVGGVQRPVEPAMKLNVLFGHPAAGQRGATYASPSCVKNSAESK